MLSDAEPTAVADDEAANDGKVEYIGTLAAGSNVEQGLKEAEDAEEDEEATDLLAEEVTAVYWGATVVKIPEGAVSYDEERVFGQGDKYDLQLVVECPDCEDSNSDDIDNIAIDFVFEVMSDDEWRDRYAMDHYLAHHEVTWNKWRKVTFSDEAWDSDNEDVPNTYTFDVEPGEYLFIELIGLEASTEKIIYEVWDASDLEDPTAELEVFGKLTNEEITDSAGEEAELIYQIWADEDLMMASDEWEELNPTTVLIDTTAVNAGKGDTLYLSKSGVDDEDVSDGCDLDGPGVDDRLVTIIGMVRPFPNDAETDHYCGVLLTIDEDENSAGDEIVLSLEDNGATALDITITIDGVASLEDESSSTDREFRSVIFFKVPEDDEGGAVHPEYAYKFSSSVADINEDYITVELKVTKRTIWQKFQEVAT